MGGGQPQQTATRSRLVRGGFAATIVLIVIGLLWRPWQPTQSNTTTNSASSAPVSTGETTLAPSALLPPPVSTQMVTPTMTTIAPSFPSGACSQPGMVSDSAENSSFSLCTSNGWVHIDMPLVATGGCARVGTVAPSSKPYSICTPVGWVDVYRPVCGDFGDYFREPDGYQC